MKYVLAILAIIGEFFVILFIAALMGFRHVGILIQLFMFAAFAATWRAITKEKSSDHSSDDDNSAETKTEIEDNK